MAQRTDIVFTAPFAARGLALAEQRLDYLTELFDTGRWRRFHTEADFLQNIREAKAALESWRRIVAVRGIEPATTATMVRPLAPPAALADPLPQPLPRLQADDVGGIAAEIEIDLDSLVTDEPDDVTDTDIVAETTVAPVAISEALVAPDETWQGTWQGTWQATLQNEQAATALWRGSRALLPDVSFSAHGVGRKADLRKA
jgi:uncharacterized repeat protein (TIGR03809 family)